MTVHTPGECQSCPLIHSVPGAMALNRLPASHDLDREVARVLQADMRRVLADRDTQIARLKAELDAYQGRTVYHCQDRDMETARAGIGEPGAILRATDSGRELEWRNGAWQPR